MAQSTDPLEGYLASPMVAYSYSRRLNYRTLNSNRRWIVFRTAFMKCNLKGNQSTPAIIISQDACLYPRPQPKALP